MAFSADQYVAVLPDESRLVLRAPTFAEIEALTPVPEHVKRYLGGFSLDGTAQQIMREFSGNVPRQVCWGIEAHGRIVGVTGLAEPMGQEEYPSGFVYVMDSAVWGNGIGACARTITAYHAFSQPEPPRAIGGYVHELNSRSSRMLKSIGFRHMHRGRCEGSWGYYLLANPNLEEPANDAERLLLQDDIAREKYLARLASYSIQIV